jgi:hypothetical protein
MVLPTHPTSLASLVLLIQADKQNIMVSKNAVQNL